MSEELKLSTEPSFNIPKIKKLTQWLYPISIIGLVLYLVGMFAIPDVLIFVYLLNILGVVLWIILWKELKKSTNSIVVHAIFAIILGVIGLWGFLFILIATTQANTVIKHNGNVEVTFWNIKPR
ncbi:MAG: hypothetical protein IKO40_04760 [Kiritimatiellae bacterium]|nr:hypothetical protein [Kiritimatiellia bacterium]